MSFSFSRRELLAGTLAAGMAGPVRAALAMQIGGAHLLTLAGPDGRSISVSEWRSPSHPRGVILFSHGAMSSPRFYESIIGPWVAAGYRVLAPLHVDSAEHPDTAKYPGLASWKARIEDMRTLAAHIGNRPFVAAGHSYGGLVALTLGGAAAIPPAGITGRLDSPQTRAVIAFSPPAPVPVLCTAQGYTALRVPALIETGTIDNPPGAPGPDGWKSHLIGFDMAAAGHDRYGLVLEGVDHYFGGAICRYDVPGPKRLDRLADANRVAGLFLRAHGDGNAAAKRALNALVTDNLPVRLMHK